MSRPIDGFASPRARLNRLSRFGRRYRAASRTDATGWDYSTQAIKAAARLAGPLSYQDIQAVYSAFHAEAERDQYGF